MYEINIKTAIDLGDENFVRSLIYDWYNHPISELRPERFGQGEPVKRRFEEEGVEAAIELWLKDKLPLMFKRLTPPKFDVDISGYQAKKSEEKMFPSDCTVWLSFKAGDELAIELMKFLIEKFNPGFAYLTTEKDEEEKHYIEIKDRFGLLQKYVGREVGEKLPGIYWITFFSRWAVNKVGREKFKQLNVYKMENYQDGILLILYEKSSMIGTLEARRIEEEVKEKLGKEHFFDKASFDIT